MTVTYNVVAIEGDKLALERNPQHPQLGLHVVPKTKQRDVFYRLVAKTLAEASKAGPIEYFDIYDS